MADREPQDPEARRQEPQVAGARRAEELGALLARQLRTPLEADLGVLDGGLRRELAAAGTSGGRGIRTFNDALHHPRAPVAILERIKQFAKRRLDEPYRDTPPAVLTALYFASIAAALVHAGKRITRLDDAKLREGLRWGGKLSWVDDHTRALFEAGRRKVR